MKLFRYLLVFTVFFTLGIYCSNRYYDYREKFKSGCQLPVSDLNEGIKRDFTKDDGWDSGHGEAGGSPDLKVSEDLKIGKGANYSLPDLGEPAHPHKLPE